MRRSFAVLALMLVSTSTFAAHLVIGNNDKAGQGFNDPTPAAPVGGNMGTTLGQQRLNTFQRAADLWGAALESKVDIVIAASFAPINEDPACDDSGGILGSAGPLGMVFNFEKAPKQNVAYPIALANKFAGRDLAPDTADINARFNSLVDNPTCLGSRGWYYGLDGNHGDDIDLVVVLLHEIGHGLGVSGNVDLRTGALFNNVPGEFEMHTLDTTTGLRWHQMTDAQRKASVTNTNHLVWEGDSVRGAAAKLLAPLTLLAVSAPSTIARDFDIGVADFGAPLLFTALSGRLADAKDAANTDGPSTTDGCTAYTNASGIAGKIALVDRGTCRFSVKARNAQNAGARAIVIADNRADTCAPPGMSGADADDIAIPVLSVTQADGALLRAQLSAGIDASLRVDATRRAGATAEGYVHLYAPCVFSDGSSVYHWDTAATPNLLMEPNVNGDVRQVLDITLNQLVDIGWIESPRSGRRILKR